MKYSPREDDAFHPIATEGAVVALSWRTSPRLQLPVIARAHVAVQDVPTPTSDCRSLSAGTAQEDPPSAKDLSAEAKQQEAVGCVEEGVKEGPRGARLVRW